MKRMEAWLTKTFQGQFSEFQKAIEKIAKAVEAKKATPKKKQQQPPPKMTYDSRNKALRAKYNPGMEVPTDNFNQQQANITHGRAAEQVTKILSQRMCKVIFSL